MAPPIKPNACAVAPLCESSGFEIDPRHADEDLAGLQSKYHDIVQQRVEDPLTNPRHQPRHEPLPCDGRQGDREERYVTLVWESKASRTGSRHVGIKSDLMANT